MRVSKSAGNTARIASGSDLFNGPLDETAADETRCGGGNRSKGKRSAGRDRRNMKRSKRAQHAIGRRSAPAAAFPNA